MALGRGWVGDSEASRRATAAGAFHRVPVLIGTNADGVNDDGKPQDDQDQFAELIQSLQAGSEGSSSQPVRLFTISYGEDADAITLRAIAQATGAATYNASNPATIEPVFTLMLAFLLLGERIQAIQILGAVLILSSVILLQLGRGESD